MVRMHAHIRVFESPSDTGLGEIPRVAWLATIVADGRADPRISRSRFWVVAVREDAGMDSTGPRS
jgi:hypothetical protein